MQKSRRDFAKKTAMVAAGAAVAGSATAVMAGTSVDSEASLSNGVVVGSSNKKEITYKKNETWAEYYKNAL